MKIIGPIVFKHNQDGCLTAKWVNEKMDDPSVECSVLIKKDDPMDPFSGEYLTTWIEGNNHEKALLTISKSGNTYVLQWKIENTSSVLFYGKGLLYENFLIAAYWDKTVNDTK